MKASYWAGLVQHALSATDAAGVVGVRTFADAGLTGESWPPYGLVVELSDGTHVAVALVASSAPGGHKVQEGNPDVFDPASV